MHKYILSFLIAFIFCGIFIAILLPVLKKLKARQEILSYVTEHSAKKGTPTMMGFAFVLAVCISTLIFADYNSKLAKLSLIVTSAYALVGFLDDFIKIRFKQNQGLRAYQKIIAQLSIAVIIAIFTYSSGYVNALKLPFVNVELTISWLAIPFVVIIFLATTNGVNLTDGMDGLAGSVTFLYALFMAVLVFIEKVSAQNEGNTLLSYEYDNLIILCLTVCGSLLAFLIVNAYPAKAFMGDVGSLSLGALISCISIFSGLSLYIVVLGLVYVWSCLSVIIQVIYFKISKGKRVFTMAPYHHHLQQKGLSETRIAVIYSSVTILAGCLLLYFSIGGV